MRQRARKKLESLGLRVSFGNYIDERDNFDTGSVRHRLEDLHNAVSDPNVKAIIAANGGSSANQLLKHIDYNLLWQHPKIFCGLSDITELTSAIYAKTGLVTYYGPHFTMIGATHLIDHSIENMKKTFFSEDPFPLISPQYYSDSEWDQEMILNDGFWTINPGEAEGISIGGNLLTFNLLLGSEYNPSMDGGILFLEENKIIDYKGVQKELQQILNHPEAVRIKGIVLGRFQRKTGMTRDLLTQMVKSKKELEGIPVIANVDCSHTAPMLTFPIGGLVRISAESNDRVTIEMLKH